MNFSYFRAPALSVRASILLCAMITPPVAVYAQTLQESIALAKNYQSERRLAGLQVQDQAAQLAQIRAQYGFKLSANAEIGAGYITTEKNALFPEEGKRFPQTVGMQFSYPLYTAGRQQLAVQAAQTSIEAAEANVGYVDTQAALAAISLHAAITRDLALIQLEQDNQRSLDQAARDAGLRLKAGEVTKTDLAQANARQAQGAASQSRAEATLLVDQSRYVQLTGQSPQNLEPLQQVSTVPSLTDALTMIESTPLIENARLQLKAAQQQLELSHRESYPSIQLAGRANTQDDSDFSTSRLGAYGVSLQASLPILDGGTRKAEVLRSQARVAIAQEQLDSNRRQLQQRLTENYAMLQTSQNQYPALIKARDAAQLALQTIRRELELGTRTTYDLLTAEQTLLDANTQLILNQEDQALNAYQILAQLNRL
ncbi:TolC family protein [Alkanindiges illinoisensis]|uniref:TolC family protein n=1 Tax=Alkanindiges illinoisensis TaxID=197183 RepID=UPI00047D4433|nr:TolC family protein [Alkanindiges illinoisensis]